MTVESTRSCPVCDGAKRRILHHQQFLDGPIGDGYDVAICEQCGAGFADGIPSQATMDSYYAEQSKYTYSHTDGAGSPWDIKRFEATLDQVIPRLTSRNARILDVGCATAGLLALLKARGYENVLGFDPSQECADTAKRMHGIEVRTGSFLQMENWTESFDLILMVGVLEHLHEAALSIRIISKLLRPDGLFYCAVPDVEGLADCANAPYQQFSVEHVNFFSKHSLDNSFIRNGLSPLSTSRWTIEWRERVFEPIASGIYKLGASGSFAFDYSTAPALERYLYVSKKGDDAILAIIESLKKSGTPILAWGAGTLTRRLLATTDLAKVNIRAFVDSNPNLTGHTLANRPILAPDQIQDRKEHILICSQAFESEIVDAIRKKNRLGNPIIFLRDLTLNAPQ
jgi:SAM-dependent methyltransferase